MYISVVVIAARGRRGFIRYAKTENAAELR